MNYEEFKDKVTEDVKRELESRNEKSYEVLSRTVEKTNENYDALSIKIEDGALGVNLNLGELYRAYENGHSYDGLSQISWKQVQIMCRDFVQLPLEIPLRCEISPSLKIKKEASLSLCRASKLKQLMRRGIRFSKILHFR